MKNNPKKPEIFFLSRRLLFTVALLIVTATFFPSGMWAQTAEIFMENAGEEIVAGNQLEVGVFISTQVEKINAIEGKVTFDAKKLYPEGVKTGDSIVGQWIENPKFSSEGEITFKGAFSGGFQGERGKLFSIFFIGQEAGEVVINSRDIKVYTHDGKGTELAISPGNLVLMIKKAESKEEPNEHIGNVYDDDKEPPENFQPQLGRQSDIFDGQWFVVFSAEDKNSGISHYEIKESQDWDTGEDGWHRVEKGPYLLADQSLRSYAFIKAVDQAGNEKLAVIEPEKKIQIPGKVLIYVISTLAVIVLLYLMVRGRPSIK